MATFNSRYIFFSTSPRNPRLIPKYLKIIIDNKLNGKTYNKNLQIRFYRDLVQSSYSKSKGDIRKRNFAFAGRDKLTRMPQALGFLIARHRKKLQVTRAGKLLLNEDLSDDVLLHQILKFQLPSPLHTTSKKENYGLFNIKPFLEIIRLIYKLKYLTYKEFSLFGMTLTDYHSFSKKLQDIKTYRKLRLQIKSNKQISVKKFFTKYREKYMANIYSDIIRNRDFHTRETKTSTEKSFLKKKISNLLDYSDAVYRTLKLTGLITVSLGKTMTITKNRIQEVKYILSNVSRKALYLKYSRSNTKDRRKMRGGYDSYLSNPTIPYLWSDNKKYIIKELQRHNVQITNTSSLYSLKERLYKLRFEQKEQILTDEQNKISNSRGSIRNKYINSIISYYDRITHKDFGDYGPSLFEWNTWRAMSMIDNGNIHANFVPDDNGKPLSPAHGNLPDVLCAYNNFDIATEVTLTNGHTQYDAESESVTRHVGMLHRQLKKEKQINKDTFGLFIAPNLDYSTQRFFYYSSIPVDKYYGEVINVIPLNLNRFIKLFKTMVTYNISPQLFFNIHKSSIKLARKCIDQRKDASTWYKLVLSKLIYDTKKSVQEYKK